MEQPNKKQRIFLVYITVALAYASAGEFPQAIETTQEALEFAIANEGLALEIGEPLRLYRAGQPCRGSKPDYTTDEDTIDLETTETR